MKSELEVLDIVTCTPITLAIEPSKALSRYGSYIIRIKGLLGASFIRINKVAALPGTELLIISVTPTSLKHLFKNCKLIYPRVDHG